MKNILFVNGHAHCPSRWGIQAELLMRLQENSENNIYVLDCNNMLSECWIVKEKKKKNICKKCLHMTRYISKKAGIKEENCLKLRKITPPRFPKFKLHRDITAYHYDGYEFGLGPVSSVMTMFKDHEFCLKKHANLLEKHLQTVYIVIKNLEELQTKYNFEEFHIFNGRATFNFACVSYAKKHKIPFTVYDRASCINSFEYAENGSIHDLLRRKEDIKQHWEKAELDRVEKAIQWYKERRNGKFQAWPSFTISQKLNLLPKNFDFNKENITFFNSSMHEIAAFETWKHPLAQSENEVIINILEHYKEDESKHFYLRIHPNLKLAKVNNSTQIREINSFRNKYKNLTVIDPDEEIDTYALINASDKIIVGYSTAGAEATFHGKPAILTGRSPYEDLDCTYKPKSYEEIYKLIDNKDLQAKPKENTYPLGYYCQTFGEKYKYYHNVNDNIGEFLSEQILNNNDYSGKLTNLLKAEFRILKDLIF